MRSSASQNPSLPSLSVFTSYNLIVSLLLFLFLYPLYVSFHESLVHRALISSFLSSKFHSKTPKKCLPSLNFFSTYCQYHSFVQWEDWKKKNHDYFLFSHLDYRCLENKNNLGIPTVPKPYKYLWLCTFKEGISNHLVQHLQVSRFVQIKIN